MIPMIKRLAIAIFLLFCAVGTSAAPPRFKLDVPWWFLLAHASNVSGQIVNPGGGSAFSGGLGASFQDVTEIAAPANPSAGNDRLYLNSTTHLLACLTSSGGNCIGGGGGTPGGSNTQVQYNNSSAFGGITNFTSNGTNPLFTAIAAPASPSSGFLVPFEDSTDLRFHDKNASGTIGTTVVSDAGAANNFLTAISTAGVISKAQPSYANLSGSDPATVFPVTVSGTVTSGGIPCFSSTTTEQTSVALTVNVLPKGGGAGACPTNSSVTDNGTTVSTTELITTSVSPSASQSALNATGAPFTGGTTTTNFPLFNLGNGAAVTTWSINGTIKGINAGSGFAGNLEDYHINGGPSVYSINYLGGATVNQVAGTTTALTINNTTAATSSTAQSTPYDFRNGTFWYNPDFNTGSPPIAAASAIDCWSHQVVETNGSNGISQYVLTHNGVAPNCAGSPAAAFLIAPYSESYGVTTLTVAQAGAPTVAAQGATGAATWTYAVVACTGPTCSNVSTITSIANGNATLTTSNWNKITWSTVTAADYYQVYRTVSGGTPASLGAICKIPAGATLECDDKALTGDATTAQAYNATGQMCLGTCPAVGGGTGGGMFGTEGTAPTQLASTADGWYTNSTNHCFDVVNGTTDVGCAAALGRVNIYGAFLQLPTANTATLASDFTDSNASGLQAITGLSFTLLANSAYKYKVDCDLMWSQATNVADTFGLQDVTVAPTRIDGYGLMSVAGPAAVITNAQYGVLTNLTTTTATGIVTATPTVTTVNFAQLHFSVQQPSNASTSVLQIMVQQATAADVIVVRAGSSCSIK